MIKEEIIWIKLNFNGIYYRNDYIEIVEGNEVFKRDNKSRNQNSNPDRFKVRMPTKISDPEDGSGYGGG